MGEVGFQKLKDNVAVPVPKIVGLPLNQKKEKALGQIRVATLEEDIRLMANTLLPILNGENLPARAYQAFKKHDSKFKAQKRRGKEVTLQTDENQGWVKGATLERRFGIWKRDEEMQEKSRAVGIVKNDNDSSKANVSFLDARRAYEIAETRYGEKGRRFLDGLKESGQVKEASQRAGISRQMGHKHLIEIRKISPTKKKIALPVYTLGSFFPLL